MQINKRNRGELKAYFAKNAVPTENQFADLIDGALVQKDDGVAKLPGTPLSIEASGDDTSQKDVLALYNSFADANAAWRVSLNPRQDPNNPASARAGFSVSDSAGRSRLFIDATSGNVGLGTNNPTHPLHVRTGESVGLFESTGAQAYLRIATREGLNNRVEVVNRPGGRLALWVAGGGDALNVLRDGRVGIGNVSPNRQLHVGGAGQVSLQHNNNIGTPSEAGLYWNTNRDYALARTPGGWSGPNYQQLEVRWPTGIVLRPGTGDNAGYGKSWVEITGGKGLRVSQGQTVIGPGNPSGLLKIGNNANFAEFLTDGAGGVLRSIAWNNGWNINAQTDGKHLHINRDSGSNSNLYLGKAGREIHILGANGNVGIGIAPRAKLDVNGDAWCHHLRADDGVTVGQGNRSTHIEHDGAMYRFDGQLYFTVDDNLYIRDMGGGIKFHFDTNNAVLRQDGWTGAPLTQGWVNYGGGYNGAGFFRDRQGIVHLRGLVRGGSTGYNATIFVLPGGYRPAARELIAVCTSENTIGRVDIMTDGRVVPSRVSNAWVSLDNITFRSF